MAGPGEERVEAACRLSGSLCQAKGGRNWVESGQAASGGIQRLADYVGVAAKRASDNSPSNIAKKSRWKAPTSE